MFLGSNAIAGSLNYTTYLVSTYAPSLENPYYDNVTGYNSDGSNSSPNGLGSVLSTGTISTISGFDWGSGQVLDSGRSDNVAVKVTGYITWPGTSGQQTTGYFGIRADDGFVMNIDGTNVVQDWQQQGPGYWNSTGSLTRTGGQQYAITVWMYEWGGGAVLDAHYSLTDYSTTNQTDMPTSMFSTTSTPTSVSITSSQSTSVTTAQNRTITGNSIRITQSGANLDLDIVQSGDNNFIEGSDWSSVGTLTGDNLNITLEQGSDSLGSSNNNGIGIDVDGDTNTVMVRQGTMGSSDTGGHKAKVKVEGDTNTLTLYQYNAGAGSSSHYSDIDILGTSNTVTTHQRDNSAKVFFLDLDGSSNTLTIDQKETGNHYLDIDVNGNSHTITATQRGSGDHGARISVTNSGGASTVTLDQNSSTDQNYTLTQDCTNNNGCSTSVTQN